MGSKVFGFAWKSQVEKGYQTYVTVPATFASPLPANLALREAATVPTNLVTAFHVLTADLGLPLPWPVPERWDPNAEAAVPRGAILVWGAGGSVGQYAVQVLRHWGYGDHVIAVASGRHHEMLRALGATGGLFDYRDTDVVERVLKRAGELAQGSATAPRIPLILDCIGSAEGTLRPIARIAERGTKVAVMLPVMTVHASEEQAPVFEMDVRKSLPGEWQDGVELFGTRTHSYDKVRPSHPLQRPSASCHAQFPGWLAWLVMSF